MLEKDPQELFAAIKDASGIANYLMEKGGSPAGMNEGAQIRART